MINTILSPVDVLCKEHEVCSVKLTNLEKCLYDFKETKDIDKLRTSFEEFYNYMKIGHKLHTLKEEILFKFMIKNLNFENTFINRLLDEHDTELLLLQDITDIFLHITDFPDIRIDNDELIFLISEFISTLRKHFWDEEKHVFNFAKENLTDKDLEFISSKIKNIRFY